MGKNKRRSSKIFKRLSRRLSTSTTGSNTTNTNEAGPDVSTPDTKRKRSRLSLLSRSSNSSSKLQHTLDDSSFSEQSVQQSEEPSEMASSNNTTSEPVMNDVIAENEGGPVTTTASNITTTETEPGTKTSEVVTETSSGNGATVTQTVYTEAIAGDYSPLSPRYLAQAGRSRSHQSSHSHSHSHSRPFHHSYDHRFSTTALSQLSMTSNLSRGASPAPSGKSKSSTSLAFDDPLLHRTGSRVWEEVSESKGQVWLQTRQTSTRFDDEQASDNNSGEEDGILRIGFQRPRDMRRSSVENDPLDNSRENDDTWYSERVFMGTGEAEEGDVADDQDILGRSRFITFVDWALGLEQDSISPTVQKRLAKDRKQLTRDEKIKQRDAERPVDVAWYLGLLSNLF